MPVHDSLSPRNVDVRNPGPKSNVILLYLPTFPANIRDILGLKWSSLCRIHRLNFISYFLHFSLYVLDGIDLISKAVASGPAFFCSLCVYRLLRL